MLRKAKATLDEIEAICADAILAPGTRSLLTEKIASLRDDISIDPVDGLPNFTGKHLLSKREKEVMVMVLDGGTSKSIARALGISHRTVEDHRTGALRHLKVPNWIALFQLIFLDRMPAQNSEFEAA